MNIAVVIPCYNEASTIKDVIVDYKQYFDYIYVYDNNSTDETVSICRSEDCYVLPSTIKGKGATVKLAFSQLDEDIVVIVDGDSTYSAIDSYNLVKHLIDNNLDMVVGNRLSSGYFKHNQIIHGIGNKVFSKIASYKYKVKIDDLLSGSRVFSKRFYKNVELKSNGFELETELTKYCVKNDYKMAFIDIDYKARPIYSKSSIHALKDGLKILFKI